jgi:hypothetical protein
MRLSGWRRAMAMAWMAGVICGCGSDETRQYDVAGTVTVAGKSVPVGTILFTPDRSKDNHGPSGFAQIREGKYDTARDGKATVGGPHVVRISAYTGVPVADRPSGKPLVADYSTEVDLPPARVVRDFEIPAAAGKTSAPSVLRSDRGP